MDQNYKLNTLKELVVLVINGGYDQQTLNALDLEIEDLPDRIRTYVFTLQSDDLVGKYISWHQEGLVKLLNLLYKEKELMQLYTGRHVLVILLNGLKDLLKLFPEHAINALSIPKVLLDRGHKKVPEVWAQLKMEWERRGVEQALITIIAIPVIDYMAVRVVSFREQEYLDFYLKELLSMNLDTKKYNSIDQLMVERLLMLNYNTERMQEYCISGIRRHLDKCKENKNQMHILTIARKALNQIAVIEGRCYDSRYGPITLTLNNWLNEEMVFVRDIPLKMLNVLQNPFKILRKLKISVPVMAYLTKLLINHGVFEKDETAVLNHIVDTYCSKETDRMSPKNFYNNFNSPTDSAVRAVRKIIRSMLVEIDEFLNTGLKK